MSISKIQELLGSDSESLLTHQCKTIDKSHLHLPGNDFIDRAFAHTNRSPQVLRSLNALYNHGRLAGTGYVSILPVDQGIEHSAGASFAPNPIYFDPENIVKLAVKVKKPETSNEYPSSINTQAKQALYDVPVYFAGQQHAAITSTWGEVSTSRKTNAVGKSDEEACQWALLSALKVLQENAQKRGFDAVVNVRSNYQNKEFSSATEFQCGSGAIMAGVALKGDIVKF